MNQKLNHLQEYMVSENIDVVYLDNPNTVAYFTNFESNPHERIVAYIVTQKDHFLFVPTLEKEEASSQSNVENIYSYNDEENPWKIIAEETSKLVEEIHYYCVDKTTLTVERDHNLSHAFLDFQKKDHTISSDDISAIIDQMRVVKEQDEIDKMIVAGKLADEALQIGIDSLVEGITEQEVAAIIDMEMKKRGVSEMSFSTLVLFGDHAASPHGNPGERQLKQNEFVLFDLGVIYNGYASDVTRTIAFGEISEKEEEVYEVVLEAQRTAQEAVKPGMRAGELDQIARQVIADAGYGKYFNHRLGHGIGKTAHEFPSIHGSNETILEPGMCFSIEPGIYVPGEVGVRIEDCVYVTEDGCEPFTLMDKELYTIVI
jgi:Xaa-Pro dipeptidase